MTPDGARSTSNLVIAAAAGGVAFIVFRNPRWRRAITRMLWTGLTSTLPAMLMAETRDAWGASGHGP
jgi:hypothetical protein